MPPAKRQKIAEDDADQPMSDTDGSSVLSASGSGSEPDTEDEIAGAKQAKSKKTLKRKRRATDAVNFGATLQSLLTTNAPSDAPLSLKPSLAKRRNEEKLEAKGKHVLLVERKEKEDRGHITDVIGGWGGESERALRKVAQRGVVKLFNVIQQSQASAATAAQQQKSSRGTGKPSLPAPVIHDKKKKGKQKDAMTGQSKDSKIGQDDFLDMIRSGGIVSKA